MPDQVETCRSEAILTEIPHLRAYARLMTDDVSSGDQQVTETLRHALSNIEGLCKRSGLRVQLLRILRNFLIDNELEPRKFKGLSAIYQRLEGPFRNANGLDGQKSPSPASALLCELHGYDARVRCGFARLAELLPAEARANSPSEATYSRAFSGLNKALELQEMLARS